MLKAGDVIAHRGVLFCGVEYLCVWHGGCGFTLVDPETETDMDCWSTMEAPTTVREAVACAGDWARRKYDDDAEEHEHVQHGFHSRDSW